MKNKKYLIFSYNKVPLVENDIVEGTGLRYWRLAKGFVKIPKSEVVIAVLDKNNQSGIKDGIKVISFSNDIESIKKLINSEKPDVIIASYWMSGIARKILDSTPSKCIFITDAYSPFYVEFFAHSSSRAADNSIMQWYPSQLEECNYLLAKADYVLTSNDKQEELYRGVIAALGQDSYSEEHRFIRVPGAVESSSGENNPRKIDPNRKEILWFGGMYPWFDFSNIIELFSNQDIARVAYLRVIGGWNPIYKKNDKRYNGQYTKAYSEAKKRGLINNSIYFEDWVTYDERLNIFASADWAISMNSDGAENAYSWRIRVADLAGNDVPVMTNGGDPLGEWLINNGLASRLDLNSSDSKDFINLLNDNLINQIKSKLKKSHANTQIYSYIENLIEILNLTKIPPRNLRAPGIILGVYEDSKGSILEAEKKYQDLEKMYEYANSELEHLRKYIDTLPKSLSTAIPFTLRLLIKRITKKLR